MTFFARSFVSATILIPLLAGIAFAEPAPTKSLIDLSAPSIEKRFVPSSKQVTIARGPDAGVLVTIQPGKENYPGVALKPEGAPWDLSAFGHVDAKITNTGDKPISVTLRLDNEGDWRDNPFNAEANTVKPGATGTVTVIFGYSYGRQRGYALKPGSIVNILLFATKSDSAQSFRIDSLIAAGPAGEKPPVDPNSIRIAPKDGILIGEGAVIDAAKQITARGAQASVIAQGSRQFLKIDLPSSKTEQSIILKPLIGRWDLRDCLEVRAKLKNAGQSPITARICIESNAGPTDWASISALAPGEEKELILPFIAPTIWNGQKGEGNRVLNDAISGVTIRAEASTAGRVLLVESVQGRMPPAPPLPEWLGKRPPVEGEWTKTFEDNFDGAAIDTTKWQIYGENYWDKQSHFSKENVIVGDGVVKLRFTKKTGHQNDDPKHKRVTPYACGFLYTYDRWAQRYGYFEARMKLPTAPGLWPAFWMMPDRGPSSTPPSKRQTTSDGGMEFDIMEHLTRWGPNRYNIAMHWDGYGKDHRSIGTDKIYIQPDKDGFITAGLLWTPGKLTYYCNGREVATWENERVSSVPEIMMFTLPMGGWDNSPLDDSKLPADFIIDYVRAWQRKDLAGK